MFRSAVFRGELRDLTEPKGTVVDNVVGEVHLYDAKKRIIVPPHSSVA
ncbi:MAG: hypothetical protein MK134_03070 [Dehalococcoidia bacterium]|nr:hypothetical protein [Dehalococcoidia bacterium]